MKRSIFLCCLVCVPILLIGMFAAANADGYSISKAASDKLQEAYPGVRVYDDGERITRIYGSSFGYGSSPEDAAQSFTENYAGLFGVEAGDLEPGSILLDGRHTQPLMYNRLTGEYKFTLVYYSQHKERIPVFRSDLRLLVRNAIGYPLVLAASSLRDLGAFAVAGGAAVNPGMAESAARSFSPGLTSFTEPRLVIWAGIDNMDVEPAVAMEIIADNGMYATPDYEKWLFLVDVQTGEILYSEDMILEIDITGSVQGLATQGNGADICGPTTATPMPYARVYVQGGNTAYADENGGFVIPHDGGSPVDVYSHLRGEWFRVFNRSGSNAEIMLEVTPPGPADFIHNPDDDQQYNRAEVNGYLQANIVRDFTLTYNPAYPGLQQNEFPVNVNLNDNCNAYYDYSSINFFTSGGGCANTAFSTVIHHEYGHHLVAMAGSGQGAYGEGMGDVMGILITDDPGLAYGFFLNCNQYMRTGDNNLQYPCVGEIHHCGQLLSGCVWETRNALEDIYPETYIDTISNLAINAILLHTGDNVDPSITIDYLTLDDDDGNIWNGTPHGLEIVYGFVEQHSMDPGISVNIEHTPFVDTEDSTSILGVSADVTSFFSMEGGSVSTYYSFGDDFIEIEMVNISGDTWYGEIPNPPFETMVSYYIEAIDGSGQSGTSPENAPDSVHIFYVGFDIIPPIMELIYGPPNTINLLGPYGAFIITAWDINGVDQSEVRLHYFVNSEDESEVAMAPTANPDEFGLDVLDLGRQLYSGDVLNYYFTAIDGAINPNTGRLPESGTFELQMVNNEIIEDFEEFGIDRWYTESAWSLFDQGHQGGHSLIFGVDYPDNADALAYMEFGYDLYPYTEARIALYHKNVVLEGDTCFVLISNDGGDSWETAGNITGVAGSFVYDEYDISSVLIPDTHDYRVGFRFVSDSEGHHIGVMLDDIGWAVGSMTGVEELASALPVALSLNQNYPNPFNPETKITFSLPQRSNVTLEVFDLLGRKVIRLIEGEFGAGNHMVGWNGKDLNGDPVSSGIYFYRLATEYGTEHAKMTLLR